MDISDILLLLLCISETGCFLRDIGAEAEETVDDRKRQSKKRDGKFFLLHYLNFTALSVMICRKHVTSTKIQRILVLYAA